MAPSVARVWRDVRETQDMVARPAEGRVGTDFAGSSDPLEHAGLSGRPSESTAIRRALLVLPARYPTRSGPQRALVPMSPRPAMATERFASMRGLSDRSRPQPSVWLTVVWILSRSSISTRMAGRKAGRWSNRSATSVGLAGA